MKPLLPKFIQSRLTLDKSPDPQKRLEQPRVIVWIFLGGDESALPVMFQFRLAMGADVSVHEIPEFDLAVRTF